jgi:threonine/homoserine/homoserine lactone efflux protein
MDSSTSANRTRGGAATATLRVGQFVLTCLLLVGATYKLVTAQWIEGWIVLTAAIVLSFLSFKE